MLDLLGTEVFEGSLILAKIQWVEEAHGIHGTNLGLLAEIAHHSLAGNWLLGTRKAQHSGTCRCSSQGRVGTKA
eukprot:s276_g10.t1